MKKLFFILITLFYFSTNALAQTTFCAKPSAVPKIRVFSSYGKLQYDTSKNTTQITEFAKKYNLAESGFFTTGLATIDISTDIIVKTVGVPQIDNSICIYPAEIYLFIGFKDPIIHLANNLKSGTCQYDVVLRHEQTHHLINKKILDYFLPLFYDAFTKIVDKTLPLKITDTSEINNASQTLTQQYNQKLEPLIDFFKQEMFSEQQKLDNLTNYQYEKNLCN